PEVDRVTDVLYRQTLEGYWSPARQQVEDGYAGFDFPFEPVEAPPPRRRSARPSSAPRRRASTSTHSRKPPRPSAPGPSATGLAHEHRFHGSLRRVRRHLRRLPPGLPGRPLR